MFLEELIRLVRVACADTDYQEDDWTPILKVFCYLKWIQDCIMMNSGIERRRKIKLYRWLADAVYWVVSEDVIPAGIKSYVSSINITIFNKMITIIVIIIKTSFGIN